jgi:SAM-dependent methyltransferase
MKPSHLSYLRCPKTKKGLKLEVSQLLNGRIKEGLLFEPESGNKYPIVNFIPRFVSSDNYTNNFGLEWNKHSRTQYDETSGIDISGQRFWNETKWEKNLNHEVILEAGSGSGRFTKHAFDTGAMVISFDYSNAVEANYKSNGQNENLLIVQASIFEMPFEVGYFDRVFCFGVLQHTPDPRKAFTCLIESIKKGGHICTDIYLKSFGKIVLSPKYLIRLFTKRMDPARLYRLTVKYVNFMWPLALVIMKIPKIGKMINWRLMIADYSSIFKDSDKKMLKEWAILDTYDMVSPAYDYPVTLKTFKKWHFEEGLDKIEVHYGYNGIEGRALKNKE